MRKEKKTTKEGISKNHSRSLKMKVSASIYSRRNRKQKQRKKDQRQTNSQEFTTPQRLLFQFGRKYSMAMEVVREKGRLKVGKGKKMPSSVCRYF